MKEYKIDLSMYDGKVREVVSEAVQTKAFELGYRWWARGYITRRHDNDIKHFSERDMPEISAADFLALTPESVKDAPEFKPFDRVLVRLSNAGTWELDFFARYDKKEDLRYVTLSGMYYKQCIPYEGNEHLLGTTEDV